jgi:hypothetical protein
MVPVFDEGALQPPGGAPDEPPSLTQFGREALGPENADAFAADGFETPPPIPADAAAGESTRPKRRIGWKLVVGIVFFLGTLAIIAGWWSVEPEQKAVTPPPISQVAANETAPPAPAPPPVQEDTGPVSEITPVAAVTAENPTQPGTSTQHNDAPSFPVDVNQPIDWMVSAPDENAAEEGSAPAVPSSADGDGMTLRFPTLYAYGRLSIRDAGSNARWESLGTGAKGAVHIPPGKEVRLRVDIAELETLGKLPENALHTLDLTGHAITLGDLPHIKHLTGLKRLDVTPSLVSQSVLRELAAALPNCIVDS